MTVAGYSDYNVNALRERDSECYKMITINIREQKTEHITENGSRILKVTEMRLYSERHEKIFLEFSAVRVPEDGEIMWEDWNYYNPLRIFQSDYERLFLPLAESLFPITDPDSGVLEQRFDCCSLNWFGRIDVERLIKRIDEVLGKKTPDERKFLGKIAEFLLKCLDFGDIVLIEGNL